MNAESAIYAIYHHTGVQGSHGVLIEAMMNHSVWAVPGPIQLMAKSAAGVMI